MFKKIKYWLIELYLVYTKIQAKTLQYRKCNWCNNSFWFEVDINDTQFCCRKCFKEIE